MKVLVVATHLDRVEANLVAGLRKHGIDIFVTIDPKGLFREIVDSAGIPIELIPLRGRVDLRAIRRIRALHKEHRFDIIHSLSARALTNVLVATAGTGVKRVAYRGTMGRLSRFDPLSWLSFLNPGVHKLICVSSAVEEYLRSLGIPDEKLVTIYKGHNLSWYEAPSPVARRDFGIPTEAFLIGCIANVRPVKGIDVLVKAFNQLPKERDIHLLLIGELRDGNVKDLIDKSPVRSKIHTTGFRSDAPILMKLCDLFVLPSVDREGLPKALIEAMAQGVPAIVSKVGGMQEVVTDGIDGRVVPPRDPQALCKAIQEALESREKLPIWGSAARETIRTRFSIDHTIQQTVEVYQKLA